MTFNNGIFQGFENPATNTAGSVLSELFSGVYCLWRQYSPGASEDCVFWYRRFRWGGGRSADLAAWHIKDVRYGRKLTGD